MKLSVTCIGHNECYHLKELLPELLKWADEVIYLDCESTDGSYDYAESIGCRVFKKPNNMQLNVNKSYAMEQATGDWIFYVDPDERFEKPLIEEIKNKLTVTTASAFKLPRKNHFFGQWLQHGGQYPDYQLRLFRKGKGHFPNKHVHEQLVIDGPIEYLKNPMLHYPYLTISQFIKKMDFYSSFEAGHMQKNAVQLSFSTALKYCWLKPKNRFFRRYFIKGGYKDGLPGFFAACFDGVGWILRYCKFWELQKGSDQTK